MTVFFCQVFPDFASSSMIAAYFALPPADQRIFISVNSESETCCAMERPPLDYGLFYSGSAKGLVATLIQGEMLSEEEYRELKRFWESERR